MSEYEFKTKPFDHQKEVFDESKDLAEYAILWEQGTGKTKLVIDNISYLYLDGKIDAALIVAPNNVHRNWVSDEIPAHMPDRVLGVAKTFCFNSAKASTKWHQAQFEEILKHPGLAIMTISYDGFMTEAGKKAVWTFLKKRRVFYAADESHRIKAVKAKRTMSVVASAKYAPYRRIMTGTPIANGPFDIYSQMKFLNPDFWKPHSMDSYVMFKNFFGDWDRGFSQPGKPRYDVLKGYRNLDRLNKILDANSSRVLKEDVLDLPPKVYSKRYFEMSPLQRKLYEELKHEYMTIHDGELITAPLAIVRLLRLQQITCGYLPTIDGEEPTKLIGDSNPRMDLLKDVCEDRPSKTMIWARFTNDIDMIMDMLGKTAVRLDGSMDDDQRAETKERFQKDKDIKWHVGNASVGCEGLTHVQAKSMIYYNNTFKFIERLQSEDRIHRHGQTDSTDYIDLVAENSVDIGIVSALRRKMDIASQITGDEMKAWI